MEVTELPVVGDSMAVPWGNQLGTRSRGLSRVPAELNKLSELWAGRKLSAT